jgi:coenzyme F420-reducing hydrogenase gamma subunit
MRILGKSFAALIILAIAAVMIGNLASAVQPPEDHSGGPGSGCYCHNLGVGIWVNGTDTYAKEEVFYVNTESGRSFAFQVTSVKTQTERTEGLLQPAMDWMSNMSDNAKFTFDPREVKDNSPQDQNPTAGSITALFKITAPNDSGSYIISLFAQGPIITALVTVKALSPSAFASINDVASPLAAKGGAPVGVNVTLQNKGPVAHTLYMYAVDRITGQELFAKVYSVAQVAPNGTITLSGVFTMPNSNVTLAIRSGHVQDNRDIDDDLTTVSVFQPQSPPPIQTASIAALAREWAPWIVITAGSLSAVPLIRTQAQKKRPLFPKGEKLTLAIVDCALCGGCEVAIADLGSNLVKLLSDKIDLVYAPILMSAREYGPVDVAFVIGAIRTEEDLRAVKEAREKAKVLVSFGTCPAFGGLNNLANLSSKQELLEYAYANTASMGHDNGKTLPSERVPEVLSELKPLSEYVKVDLTIPGCPPPSDSIRDAINLLLNGIANGERTI